VEPCAPPPHVLDYAPPFCDSCQSSKHDTNCCPYVIAMASRLEHLEHAMNNYSESIENMTRAFMDQFSGLVSDHVERTMHVSHETDLKVGPTILNGCLLGNCESPYPLIPEVQADTHLSDF